MIEVNGKVVMISGANRGIGLAIARSLYKAGYSLSLGARNVSSLKDIIENSSDDFKVTEINNAKILRIQNSSSLKKKDLDKIIQVIRKAINEI